MKAVTYNSSKDEFSLCQLPEVQPTNDEAVVKVLACALNPVDTKIVNWHESASEMSHSFVVGLDVVVVLVVVGPDVVVVVVVGMPVVLVVV